MFLVGSFRFVFRDFSSLGTHFRPLIVIDSASILGSRLLKYCSCKEPSVENCGSPTLRFGKRSDFSLSFCPRHFTAWPTAFQITFKNNAESSLFELLRDVFSKNFQTSMAFVWFLMFISLHECGITGCSNFTLYDMLLIYALEPYVKNTFYADAFLAYISFSLRDRL